MAASVLAISGRGWVSCGPRGLLWGLSRGLCSGGTTHFGFQEVSEEEKGEKGEGAEQLWLLPGCPDPVLAGFQDGTGLRVILGARVGVSPGTVCPGASLILSSGVLRPPASAEIYHCKVGG